MRILITGSESYVGAVLCPMLYGKHIVIPYDLKHGDDICDRQALERQIMDADLIVHLAAASTPAFCEANPDLAQKYNVDAIKLLNELRGDKPVVFPNTNIGYGVKTKQDIYDENSPMEPNSIYGKTKCEGERLILEHGNAIVFRLASLFGWSESMRWNLLFNYMVKEAWEKRELKIYEGHVRRNLLHVKDVCSAFVHAIDNFEKMKGQVYNVGLDDHPTKTAIACMIKTSIPDLKIEYIEGSDPDKRDYIISSQKLKDSGWKPQYGLVAGMLELLEVLNG